MPSAGQVLRSERQKRNRSLSDIATETRISARYLEAIEQDDVKQLPGDFFYKAFLRQYAKSLDLDMATTNQIVASAVPIEEPDPLPALSQAYTAAQERDTTRRTLPTGVAVGLLVAVLAGGSALYAVWQRSQARNEVGGPEQTTAAATGSPVVTPQAQSTPLASTPSPASGAVDPARQQAAASAPGVTPPPSTSPSATGQAEAQAQQQQQSAQVTPAATTTAPAGSVALVLSSSEPVWVQLSSGGKTVFIGMVKPAEPKQFALGDTAKLLMGNAGSLEIRLNGKAVPSVGPKGQVRTVLFSGDSWTVVPPKPRVNPATEGVASTAGTAANVTTATSARGESQN